MQKYFLKFSIAVLGLISLLSFCPASASAAGCDTSTTAGSIACGANDSAGVPDSANPGKNINDTIRSLVNILTAIVGIAAVIMIIVGGFRYITSGSSPEGAKGAKNTILYAIIGLVIVALAQVVVHFVLNKTSASTALGTSSAVATLEGIQGEGHVTHADLLP